jgi:DNA uptake protein ComE-like DNA-binding protein
MTDQNILLRQLCLLLAFAVITLLFFCYENLNYFLPGWEGKGMIQQLSWNGNELTIVHQEQPVNDFDAVLFVPVDLNPMFFQRIPINEADCELLMTVPGIGPTLAQNIHSTRRVLGRFKNADDLLSIPGIGRKKSNQFKEYFSFN